MTVLVVESFASGARGHDFEWRLKDRQREDAHSLYETVSPWRTFGSPTPEQEYASPSATCKF